MKKIEELLEPFDMSIGGKQDFLTILTTIKNSKFSFEEIILHLGDMKSNLIESLRHDKREQLKYEKIALRCPECEAVMFLYNVNDKPNVQVGEGLKSQWYCARCAHTVFNKKSIQEILKEMRR